MKKKSEKRLVGDRDGHVLEFEYVPTAEKAREMYVVYDGRRIAYRGKPGTSEARRWISMEPGVTVVDVGENYNAVRIYFSDDGLQ
jgi:hypothetical protein